MRVTKRIFAALLILHMAIVPNLKANACHPGEPIPVSKTSSGRFPIEAAVLGGIYTVTAVDYGISNIVRDIPKLSRWGEIADYHETSVFSNKELSKFLISNAGSNPLFENATVVALKDTNNDEKLVSMFKFSINKSKKPLEKTFLVESSDIKNNSLHLHYIKIPEEFVKTKHKLIASVSLIYKNTAPDKKLDFNVFKKTRLRSMEGLSWKIHGKETFSENKKDVYTITREFKLSPSMKTYVLAVFAPKDKAVNEDDKIPYCCGKYVALVKIKSLP